MIPQLGFRCANGVRRFVHEAFAAVRRASYARQTSAKTCSTVMACMQTLLRQGDWRLLYAFTHGLHMMPAHNAVLRGVRAANNAGVSGPNNVTTRIGVSVAKCAGPAVVGHQHVGEGEKNQQLPERGPARE